MVRGAALPPTDRFAERNASMGRPFKIDITRFFEHERTGTGDGRHTDGRADAPGEALVAEGFRLVLRGLGADLDDPHYRGTPERAARAFYRELCASMNTPPPEITTFPHEGYDQMIAVSGIPVKSLCAHHLLPFVGTATVAYIPGRGEVLGLSKLSRIVDYCSRKPQVQERLTIEIADMLWRLVAGEDGEGGAGVFVTASHHCMCMRGVNHHAVMTTSNLRGAFTTPAVCAEFMAHARSATG
jgi:GTP cyclohydrolase IA